MDEINQIDSDESVDTLIEAIAEDTANGPLEYVCCVENRGAL